MMEYSVDHRHDSLLNESVYKIIHSSGLEIQFMPKAGYTKKFAYFATRYGAMYNNFELKDGQAVEMPLGIAHFLEHKIFEESDGDIFDKFSRLGANVNAYTNFNSTAYMFSTVDNFYDCLKLLLGFVQRCHLTDDNVEKEKGIIGQEIKMYDDDPDWKVYFNTLKEMYHNHPVREDVAGSIESVYATTRDQLQMCYDSFYVPENMILFVVGDLELDEIMRSVEAGISTDYAKRGQTPKLLLPEEPKSVREKEVRQVMNVPVPLFMIGFKDPVLMGDPKRALQKTIAMKLALDMYFGKSSTFYSDNYEAGIINASFYHEYSSGLEYGHVMFGGESAEYEKVFEAVKEEIKKIQDKGIDHEAFNRVKRKAIGRYLSAFNSVQYVAGAFVSYFMKHMDLFDYLGILEDMSPEFVENTIKTHLKSDNVVLSVVE
ncbi:EF-P 5-aminopentanol modification-associated protein YfmH [Fusibacter sp. JL216-2]|uniref:EF-P 5-aminopentanol modification-associated protein YfmH n=1 Tax=Fusibacter sp. JL216-2 TaxID=3071453 RepID=UPI003D331E65